MVASVVHIEQSEPPTEPVQTGVGEVVIELVKLLTRVGEIAVKLVVVAVAINVV